jgi:hypothetical protein
MWEPFQRYRALVPHARGLFRNAVALFPLIRIHLRSRGYKKTQQWLQKRLHASPQASPNNETSSVSLTCRMVNAAAHYGIVRRPTCLEESLALWYFLRRQGIPSKLRIGVRKIADKFEAHAWVEYQGQALNQSDEPHKHYAAFDSEFSDPPGDAT